MRKPAQTPLPVQYAAQIKVCGQTLPAAICRICGSRIYPPQGLKLHEEQHSPDAKRLIRDGFGGYRAVRKWESTW